MRKLIRGYSLIVVVVLLMGCGSTPRTTQRAVIGRIALSDPLYDSETSVERALLQRRSVRDYSSEALTLAEVSQLLWAAQGITNARGNRTAPSAGGIYPLEVFLVAGEVSGLEAGVYSYEPEGHELQFLLAGDHRSQLSDAALDQTAVGDAPAVIVITGVFERTTAKYGDRGRQYVHIEAGSASENVYLQALSLDLGTVFIGAFQDDEVSKVLQLSANEHPLGLIPVGRKQAP
jgi:SagB-type dehydrogenase family enzyme